MAIGIIYLIGMLFAAGLLILLAAYEKNVMKDNIDDFPLAMILSIGSWIAVVFLIWAFKDDYEYMLKNKFDL